MPRRSVDNWSTSSAHHSGKTLRSGKSLLEKMRDLGFDFRSERRASKMFPLNHISIKLEDNRPSDYIIMTPNLNLMQIIYFQPDIKYDITNPERITYEFEGLSKNLKNPKEVRRITDIEVKSYKPTRPMIFRKKKRRSSIISAVEKILLKNKGLLLSKNPSEESVFVEQRIEPEKTINDLPENILLKIFQYFNRQERNLLLAMVCKSWYYTLKDPIFWTELEFHGDKTSTNMIIHLIKKYTSVKKLSFTAVPNIVDILQELCRCNHSITYLKVRNCNHGIQDFARIILHVISCCTNLETLDLKGMRFQSDRFFLELGRLKHLKSINLTGNKMIKNQNLVTLSVNCRNLRDLRILNIFLNNEQGSVLQDADIIYIFLHLQANLETLKIDMQQLKTVSYQAILKCSKLMDLTMKNCLHLSSQMFRQLSQLENLKKLKLTRGINLKPEDFQFVFGRENMSKIEDLNINGCWRVGENGLEAITYRLPSLKFLSLKNCKTIQEHHLIHLSRCPELTYLNIAHTGVELNSPTLLHHYVKRLDTLVIDSKMAKVPTIQKLKTHNPSLKIAVSFSEFQKVEKFL